MSKHLLLVLLLWDSCLGQQYPTSFLYNGCSYSFKKYQATELKDCRKKELQLVFEDNFDSSSINTIQWRTDYPWGRALHSSNYGTGFDQTYALNENVSTKNGLLYLHIKEDAAVHPSPDDPSQNIPFKYSSGMLFGNYGYGYGKYEIKCKIPRIEGIWPAFWMYAFCAQELDVFEFINKSEESDPETDSGNMIMTYHRQFDCTDTSLGHCQSGLTRNTGKNLSEEFHTYSLEWDEYKLVWKLDDEIMREVYRFWVLSPSLPDGPLAGYAYPVKTCRDLKAGVQYAEFNAFPIEENLMHVIVGGSVYLKKNVKVPQDFIVDYIKVYDLADKGPDLNLTDSADFMVYPNPVVNELNVPDDIWGNSITSTEILNALGERVHIPYEVKNGVRIYDLHSYPAGVYFVRIFVNSSVFIKKVIHYPR
jgi:hypothetical protein